MQDFTLKIYKKLLEELLTNGYSFQTLQDFIQQPIEKAIILRHDVDRLPSNALVIAEIEKEAAIRASYYFRIVKESYDENIIRQIMDMGHEIGYHYEDLSLCRGNYELAIKDFELNLGKIREFYPAKTICMHGSPFSKYDNKKIWDRYDYRDYGIIAEPYFDIDYDEVFYITDTGRAWNNSKVSVRDKVIKTEVRGRRSEDGKGEKVRRSEKQKIRRSEEQKDGGRRTEDGPGMNRMPGWKKTGFRDKVIKTEVRSRRSEVGGGKTQDKEKAKFDIEIKNTYHLIEKIQNNELPDKIMMNVHPQRWNDEFVPWVSELVRQSVKNVVKKLLVRRTEDGRLRTGD